VPPKGYGAGEPIRLAGFQREWLAEVLADGVTSAALELPRGNGKSSLLACVALWALFDGNGTGAPQVPVVATTLRQAVLSVYGVALAMIEQSPELAGRCKVFSGIGTQRVVFPWNRGEMFPISNDPDGLQGLDPSVSVCDEIGFMPVESWNSLLLASGKRPRSLVVGIGTPGFDRQSALWQLRQRHLSGDLLPGFRFHEYAAPEGCDITDETQWRAANPALDAGFMNVDALRMAVAISPEGLFRTFRLGQWVEGIESWLGDDGRVLWSRLADPWDMQEHAPTWVGVDVALKHDSTAICWVQHRPDGRCHVKARIWLPAPDGRLDVTDAMHHLRELAKTYDVKAVSYDPRFFDLPAQQLADEGLPMLEIPQSLERMTPAVGAAFEAIKRSELSHDGDQAFDMQVLAAVARYNERGFTLAKSKSKDRIDACIAMVLALWEALQMETPVLTPFVLV
jgi:phage terminase large subunit-like protein